MFTGRNFTSIRAAGLCSSLLKMHSLASITNSVAAEDGGHDHRYPAATVPFGMVQLTSVEMQRRASAEVNPWLRGHEPVD